MSLAGWKSFSKSGLDWKVHDTPLLSILQSLEFVTAKNFSGVNIGLLLRVTLRLRRRVEEATTVSLHFVGFVSAFKHEDKRCLVLWLFTGAPPQFRTFII